MKIRMMIGIGVVLAVLVGIGFVFFNRTPVIDVVQATRGPAVLAVYATGTVEPSVTIPAAPRQTARLVNLFVDEGQSVQKGTVMAQFEDADLRNILIDRQASLDLAQKEYDRQYGLMKSGAISKQTFDKTVAALNSAKANVAQAEANLEYLKLIAPEDGQIIRRDGEIGELIPAGQAVFWMSCCKGYRISSEVDEEDISLVSPGQNVLIRADAFPNDTFQGVVQSITPKGDATARSYRVRIGLNDSSKLMIGMTAEANIMIREDKNALLLPDTAIVDDDVLIVKEGRVQKTKIETGARAEGKVEIRSGITEADIVILDATAVTDMSLTIRTRLVGQSEHRGKVR